MALWSKQPTNRKEWDPYNEWQTKLPESHARTVYQDFRTLHGQITETPLGWLVTYILVDHETDETIIESSLEDRLQKAANWFTWRTNRHRCRECGELIRQEPDGRPRDYCSNACKQAAYRARAKA